MNFVDDVAYACLRLQLKLDEVYTIPEIQLWRQQPPLHQAKPASSRSSSNGNPQGNAKAVNEAWTAAGMKGTISHPIISQVRKQLGLTGNLPGKTRNAAKEKAASNMPRTATPTPGKTSFVKEFLNDHPEGTTKTVNEAWQAAGFEGTISPTLVNKTRVK